VTRKTDQIRGKRAWPFCRFLSFRRISASKLSLRSPAPLGRGPGTGRAGRRRRANLCKAADTIGQHSRFSPCGKSCISSLNAKLIPSLTFNQTSLAARLERSLRHPNDSVWPGGSLRSARGCRPRSSRKIFPVVCYLNDDFAGGGHIVSWAWLNCETRNRQAIVFPRQVSSLC